MHLTNKHLLRLGYLLLALTLAVGILILYNLNKAGIYNELVTLDLVPKPEKLTELYFNTSADLPGSTMGNLRAETYIGTIFDASSNVKTRLSMTGIQQNQGKITGYLVLGAGLPGSGPFSGTIDATNHIRLIVKDGAGRASTFLEGVMQSTTNMSGVFYRCSSNSSQSNQCSRAAKGYGTWDLEPAVSFTFVIHNLETTDYQYVYEVSVNANGTSHIVDRGNVLVKDNQYYVKDEEFNLINTRGRQEVTVELVNLRQSIDFWIGGN